MCTYLTWCENLPLDAPATHFNWPHNTMPTTEIDHNVCTNDDNELSTNKTS